MRPRLTVRLLRDIQLTRLSFSESDIVNAPASVAQQWIAAGDAVEFREEFALIHYYPHKHP